MGWPNTKEYYRSRRDKRLAAGVCQNCDNPSRPSRLHCEPCAERYAAKERAKREADKIAGIPRRKASAQSAAKSNAAGRKKRLERISLGQCSNCGGQPRAGLTTCEPCGVKRRAVADAYRIRRIAAGLCRNCNSPLNDHSLCLDCRIKNLCKATLKVNTGTGIWREIKAILVRQGFRCALTGDEIMPGLNASIDHILPVSRGGKHTPSNVRWVTKTVNLMRSSLSDEEFVAVCRSVVSHAGVCNE